MAKIVVTGGGLGGLMTSAVLARDGHEVTVLERDPAGPPPEPDASWGQWERRGVNQFRMVHFFMPRWRQLVEAELADLVPGLEGAGALRYASLDPIPESIKGAPRPDDGDLVALTGRRPVIEAAVARYVASLPGVEVRRGVAVAGLLTDGADGTPAVVGVRTESGEEVRGELVVDTTGRRSPLPTWLADIGAGPADEEEEDLGFVYYGRHFRSGDGSVPPAFGGLLQAYESFSVLTLPCDNGTWGVAVITSGADAELRRLKHNDVWMRAVGAMPFVAHWLQGQPLDDVAVMARIPDRHRRLVVDGAPVVTGLVAVGDAWACTNPSLGRGSTMALMHAISLRDSIRAVGLTDRAGFVRSFDEVTEATVGAWYRNTRQFDAHRLAEIQAQIEGKPYEPDDPSWEITKSWQHAVAADPDLLRGYLRLVGMLALPDELLAQPGLLDKVIEHGSGWRDAPTPGPSRAELLALVAG